MFSDTHCHLSHIEERGEDLSGLLALMGERGFPFVLDIGTKPGDFDMRVEKIRRTGSIPSFLHFSCGLWPDGKVIADRMDALKALESDVVKMMQLSTERPSLVALGECGLDRYWNGSAAADRLAAVKSGIISGSENDDGPGTTDIYGEEELFGFQLDLARKNNLAVIVHSREAFEPTLGCIKNGNFDKGVIHCFSYGIEEARSFLDRGWYISFPGNITWGKKDADKERIARLVRYVPKDRLLLETDAPYLSPSPHRGKTNTPLLIEHTYEVASAMIGMEIAELAELVYQNALALFSRPEH